MQMIGGDRKETGYVTEAGMIQRRKRGVILSAYGWQRLQAAELLAAMRDNGGKPYTLEQLTDRTHLSINTLIKVRRREKPVDQPTLEVYFAAFDLSLTSEDINSQEIDMPTAMLNQLLTSPLKGQLSLDSPFYVQRPPIEQLCREELNQPGALLRLKAPRQYGKTSLMAQLLVRSQEQGMRTAVVNFQLADQSILRDAQRFFQWFCAVLTQAIELPVQVQDQWSDVFGHSYNCSLYIESYILAADDRPLVLAIDEADILFAYPELAVDFFGMLRAWFEQAKYGLDSSKIWQRLRLLLLHSNEVYLPLNLNQSPFNVGLLVELAAFTQAQVAELASRYGVKEPNLVAERLMALLAGHPYLTQLALFHLTQQDIAIATFEASVTAPNSIFSNHLRQQLGNLQTFPELLQAMQAVVTQADGAQLTPEFSYKLQALGLIRFVGQKAQASCWLYHHYFAQLWATET